MPYFPLMKLNTPSALTLAGSCPLTSQAQGTASDSSELGCASF
ncbi:hypothetical protein swp_3437 [Shewanella piezotolerans WP3]|uniref:Uncharacterized protein n=1 Tax=Shewanella piezotolerans (strain WP3 / JCM 13877) TaxID=225849 RepID=B8CRX8_SHEPW|nr:hypothetical protein swp_3437 [Shewanella piezotolerans WP3]